MTATLTYTLGQFVWRELFSPDVAASKRFYGGLFNWTWEDRPMGPDWSYTIWQAGTKQIGGMMALSSLPEGSGDVPPHWAVYVSVADVDKAAEKAVSLGAKVVGDCHDIPGVGRFAVIQDPQGAHICLFRSATGDTPAGMPGLGEFCWESLNTSDPAKGIEFYKQVIGWSTMQMGEGEGATTLFNTPEGSLASVGQVDPGVPPHWATFVAVSDVDAITTKCTELGGQVLLGRTEIPEVGAFAILQDPTGAVIYVYRSGPAA